MLCIHCAYATHVRFIFHSHYFVRLRLFIVAGGGSPNGLGRRGSGFGQNLSRKIIEPSCRYQKVWYKLDPTWAKIPSPRHPSVSFLTHCSSATVPVSGGGSSSGHGRRGSCFWTEYCPTLLSYLSVPEGSVQVGSSHSDFFVDTRRSRTNRALAS